MASLEAADRLAMPPPPSRPGKRKVVLEEDTYAEAIEAIVERDFFPHLPKLQNQLEWLQAVQSGDPAQIKRAQLNIARRRAGLKTPLAHEGAPPTSAITPGTGLLRTPAMTPAVGGAQNSSSSFMTMPTPARTPAAAAAAAALEQQGLDPVSAQQQVGAKAPALSLDQFFTSYEGEDNASFQQLQQKAVERKRAKMAHHLEDKNKPLLLEAGVHSTDEYGTSGQTPSTLQMSKHVPKNALYYDTSEQKPLALTASEKATIVQGPPKVINHNATRSLTQQQEAAAAAATAAALAAAAAAAGGADNDGEQRQSKVAAAAVAPGTRGYGYMKTPLIMPGVDASPLMTWGDIASTPLRLDMDDDIEGLGVLGDESGGPASRQFTMPQVRTREAAAQQMLAGRSAAAASRRRGRGGSSATPLLDSLRRGSTGGTPAGGATPASRRGAALSAAGMKLAQQLKGGRPGTGPRGAAGLGLGGAAAGATGAGADLQLRASYQKGGVTPSRGGVGVHGGWDMTPGTAGRSSGGGSSRQRPMSGKFQVQAGSRAVAAAAGAGRAAGAAGAGQQQPSQQAGPGANVTDDLLQLG